MGKWWDVLIKITSNKQERDVHDFSKEDTQTIAKLFFCLKEKDLD